MSCASAPAGVVRSRDAAARRRLVRWRPATAACDTTSPSMPRRTFALALLLVLAVQFLGAMVFASACAEPGPDDPESTSCPPVCTLCSDCTHAQQAIVWQPVSEPS